MKNLVLGFFLAVLVVPAAMASAQSDWATKMFDRTSHDFGTVARGAKVETKFIIENIYVEDAHIQSVSSSCGCTTPKYNKELLKTWDKAEITVAVNTQLEPGRKSAVIRVVFDKPFQHTVELNVYSYIRGDVVVQPGAVQFGMVNQGAGAVQTCKISYAGRDDWRIEKLETANPFVAAEVVETSRQGGQVTYTLTAKLKPGAPPGYVQGHLTLVTNDYNPQSARVPISVEGHVAPALTVRPNPISFGTVAAGSSSSQNLVLQGREPFRVLAVHCSDARFHCKAPAEAKNFHILPLSFSPDAKAPPGSVAVKLQIETDMPSVKTVEVNATARVTAKKELE